jgi:hypothetical protein
LLEEKKKELEASIQAKIVSLTDLSCVNFSLLLEIAEIYEEIINRFGRRNLNMIFG